LTARPAKSVDFVEGKGSDWAALDAATQMHRRGCKQSIGTERMIGLVRKHGHGQ
jgi:hypothetical protein